MTPRPIPAVLWLVLLSAALPLAAQSPASAPKQDKITDELAVLGYRYDKAKARYVGKDGQPLPSARLRAYLAPYDYRPRPPSDDTRTGLLLDGYRLEPATGHILSPDTHKPMSDLDYESMRAADSIDERRASLERMGLLLAGQDPAKPLPAPARAQAERLMEDRTMPPALARDVASLKTLAGTVASDVHGSYLAETRAYDGTLKASDLADRDLPLLGVPAPAPVKAYFDASERALGQALQRASIARLRANPVGSELLGHFKDASGNVQLPAMVVLPVDSRAIALYAGGILAIGQSEFVESVVAQAPAARRKSLRAKLSDSRALARYLNAHPRAVEAFVKDNDVTIVHELTHAWQHRRDVFWADTDRDNFPDADYVECEHEAFLTELRYVHEKLKKDPSALAKDDDELASYQRFTADLNGWRDDITRSYLEEFPQAAATLGTAEQMQKERVDAAQELEKNPALAAIEKLKLIAFGVGSQSESQYRAYTDRLLGDCSNVPAAQTCFRRDQYPAIQKESNALLAKTFLIKSKTDRFALDRRYDAGEAFQYAQAAGDAGLEHRAEDVMLVLEKEHSP